jgi:hypothetical protein
MTEGRRVEGRWAAPVDHLHVRGDLPPGALNLNVDGRRVAALSGGFGRLWQKIYRIRLEDVAISPEDLVVLWKERFPDFWPRFMRFYKPDGLISAGDVAVINSAGVATGILVLYDDDESFSYITPEGHPFNGMITFSAERQGGVTVAQASAYIRAQDPLYELVMTLGGHRMEDFVWTQTLQNLARHVGVEAKATTLRIRIDKRRRWREFGNIRRSAALRSAAYMLSKPFRRRTRARG